jgi:hypothetical protein
VDTPNFETGKERDIMTFVVRDNFPNEEPAVQIIFRGLLALAFNGKTSCEVGIHNTTQNNAAHPHPHVFDVTLWEKHSGSCGERTELFRSVSNTLVPPGVTLTTTNPSALDGVYAYQRGTFNRRNPSSSPDLNVPFDFRWVLDLEGADFYSRPLTKNSATMRPSITIDNGLFYSFYTTRSSFQRLPVGSLLFLGHVAEIVGSNVYLNDGGEVLVRINTPSGPIDRTLRKQPGVSYQLDLTNNCTSGGNPAKCLFDPSSTDKRVRNDFFLHFETFGRNAGEREFELKAFDQVPGDSTVIPCRIDDSSTTDPAPCSPVGFGQSNNLN